MVVIAHDYNDEHLNFNFFKTKSSKMKKFKFSEKDQVALKKSISDFKSEAIKDVATKFGGSNIRAGFSRSTWERIKD